MLTTKNLAEDYKSVPSTFIFEYYCRLPERLTGQDVCIKSLFNSKDRDPSMYIYYSDAKEDYRFKDFSSGLSGTAIDLVMQLKKLPFHEAVTLILEDYNNYVSKHGSSYQIGEFERQSKFKVTDYVKRSWNTNDQKQWTPYNIGSRLLEEHYVAPLKQYTMSKEENGELKSFTVTGDFLYGYFTKSGELYKIYQPKNKEKKFIKVKNYIQGSEQLQDYEYLVIISSLKDIMSVKSLNLKVDLIAPDSENSMIPPELMKHYLKKYKKVLVLFDNDEAGIAAMKRYREEYKTPAVLLTLAKDPSDAIKAHGPKKVTEKLVPLIDSRICEL